MKRRLRKKLRVGEFREDGFKLGFDLDPGLGPEAIDAVTDDFLNMIDPRGLQYGGGGEHEWSGVVQGPWRGSATEEDREVVLRWLGENPDIVHAFAGPIRDLWHGWD